VQSACRIRSIYVAAIIMVVSGCSSPLLKIKRLNWSHSELVSHLKKQGLRVEAIETNIGLLWGPAMIFYFDDTIDDKNSVYVQVRKTEQEAKDAASPKGEDAFSWGRFYFVGDPKILSKVKQALQ
jgi:hypothetical protein